MKLCLPLPSVFFFFFQVSLDYLGNDLKVSMSVFVMGRARFVDVDMDSLSTSLTLSMYLSLSLKSSPDLSHFRPFHLYFNGCCQVQDLSLRMPEKSRPSFAPTTRRSSIQSYATLNSMVHLVKDLIWSSQQRQSLICHMARNQPLQDME